MARSVSGGIRTLILARVWIKLYKGKAPVITCYDLPLIYWDITSIHSRSFKAWVKLTDSDSESESKSESLLNNFPQAKYNEGCASKVRGR